MNKRCHGERGVLGERKGVRVNEGSWGDRRLFGWTRDVMASKEIR